MMLSQNTGPIYTDPRICLGKDMQKLDSLIYFTIIYLSPKRNGQRQHMLIKELKLLHSDYLGFNFILKKK